MPASLNGLVKGRGKSFRLYCLGQLLRERQIGSLFAFMQREKETPNRMNWDQIEGKWKQAKGAVKQQWAKLTDDDLTYMSGKKDDLVGKIQERYGITREEAQRQADEWARDARFDEVESTAAKANRL